MNLNGCIIEYSYDKLSKKCKVCMNKDYCSSKQKEKYGALSLPTSAGPSTETRTFFAAAGITAEQATEALIRMNAGILKITEDNYGKSK